MAENLIQHVKSLEAEADVIVAEARTTARQIEQSASGEADALRTEYEAGYGRDVDAFQAEQEQRVAREQADLDLRARRIADALQSVVPEAAEKAIGLILKHLREG